ncbi:MAG: hypothetical protein M5T52_24085 [Ignavibacteriaceae bacterium]|nr:hypothetical protein [Ignavibacteriaceae bacterium]
MTPEGKLRHIGFLGAAKPAIKGLADIQFSSPSSVIYEFDYEKNAEDEKPVQTKSDSNKLTELTQEINSLKETISSMQKNFSESELNTTKASIDKINSQLNSLQSKISNSDFENLLEDKVDEGTLTPAIKDKVLELSNFMQSQNFSDDFSPSKFQGEVNKLLISLLNSFPKIIYYDNFAEKPEDDNSLKDDSFIGMEIDAESKQLHKKALGLMKKENISYLSAVTKLIHN